MAIYDGELLTYLEAGQRLGVRPESVKRRAWRQGWERVEGNEKTDPVRIRVPAAVLAESRTSPPDRTRHRPRMSTDAVATLGAALERQEMTNKVLQVDLDAARAAMVLAQIETAKADTLRLAAEKATDDLARRLEREETERRTLQDQTNARRVNLFAAEARAAELQDKLDALKMKLQADLDAARAQIAQAQIDTAKADALRVAAERGADDLARRLEREETERRALQDQTDPIRVELSAAQARAAELQAKFDALEMKLQVDTTKADNLRLAAEEVADDLARRLEGEETERRTPQDQTDAVRVELSASTVGAPWRFAMASSIGTSHAANGTPCQDSFHCRLVDARSGAGVLVAVASDGAGTARCSDVGSQLACNTVGELAQDYFENGGQVSALDRATAQRWIGRILAKLSQRAATDGNDLCDYACTLIAVIASDSAAVFLQIGDGAIVVSDGIVDGWSYVFWPQHGEFANTTTFLVSPDALERLGFECVLRPIQEFAVFTDGIENLVLHRASRTVHEPFFDSVFKAVRSSPGEGPDARLSRELEKYLSTPAVTDRTDDDKTLILATRLAPPTLGVTAA